MLYLNLQLILFLVALSSFHCDKSHLNPKCYFPVSIHEETHLFGAPINKVVHELDVFCKKLNISERMCIIIGQGYMSQCHPNCSVYWSWGNEVNVFIPDNMSGSLSQQLYTFCHLVSDNEEKCYKLVGSSYKSTCDPFSIADPFDSESRKSLQPWQLANEPSSDQVDLKNFLEQTIIEEYVNAVNEITNASFDSWEKHLGSFLHPDPDSDTAQMLHTEDKNIISDEIKEEREVSKQVVLEQHNDNHELEAIYIPDFENDISSYLDTLQHWCKQVNHPLWYKNCYKFMLNLTKVPRCTTTMDSGYCKRNHSISAANKSANFVAPAVEEILEEALSTPDAFNVVILGAGPVGLMLANALKRLLEHRIRVVVFETRLNGERSKKLYEREWLTELPLYLLDRSPDIQSIFANFVRIDHSGNGLSHLPINIMETLLLLSNRANGVTFIYDDYKKYTDLLLPSRIGIVFDATGHRLSKFKYSAVDSAYIHQTRQKFFNGHVVIGQSSDVRFPTTAVSSGVYVPYTLYFLKINFLPSSFFPIMQRFEKILEHGSCSAYYCGPYFPFKISPPDNVYNIFTDHPDEVVTDLLLVSLTKEQASVVNKHFRHIPPHSNAAEISIHYISEDLLHEPEMQYFGLSELLRFIINSALPQTTITRPYRYNPYMYMPNPVPQTIHGLQESIKVFRIGNSLLSGDATASTGIRSQYHVISNIARRTGQKIYQSYK